MTRKEQIEAMLKDEPHDAELRYMLAMEHVSLGDDPAAASVFQNLITDAPTHAPAYHMLGRTLQRLGRIKEAKELLQTGIPIAMQAGNTHAAGEMQELLENLD
jgi:tetratricopeptide (TPR) repeat protein